MKELILIEKFVQQLERFQFRSAVFVLYSMILTKVHFDFFMLFQKEIGLLELDRVDLNSLFMELAEFQIPLWLLVIYLGRLLMVFLD